ncbi:putative eukaryotic translation initiation factor 3 subunit e protein [Phaeoacremonium minimum UCRPA7]|uniref:Eukaryotic translation initiation factor 3 subunit E n=1 Tax=Phaeoacremonium minimum (strain UCR-PA7) TaxID=1286976 RepID=R8BGM3_PHAM7|nr:putative eukaryotic translation initiation factor 3 subunit e protein [Phaeoacremonium minimum UCRPA7]EON98471.1 putative eukaryotic translation initiation factor 3 subunit e protein [Phaeoacremonium minimum UCRPA7]
MEEIAISEYDLLPKLVSRLDRHMIFPLLEFTAGQLEDEDGQTKDADKAKEITRAKYELLKKTNMTDYVANLYCELEGLENPPEEFAAKRQKVIETLEKYEDATQKITDLLGREDVVANLRSDKVANLDFLKKEHDVTIENVNALYDFGNFQYSCGNYGAAAELLYQFRVLSTDNDKVSAATWGRLASEILSTNWESALEELQKVKEGIDTKLFNNPLAQLSHRTWLTHWALFPLFNFDQARDPVLDLFFSPAFINTIQTACPWILRYLAAAVITGRGRTRNSGAHQKQIKDIVRIVRQEAYEYNDPVTDFIRALFIDFDFEEAQRQLSRAEEVLRGDFFLAGTADAFVDAARHLIFESYCKIHARIDINGLSARLGLNVDEGEKWIVNLIRDTRLDAKIDYKEGTVVMNHPPSSVYQQVIERTKGGFFRTQVLSAAVAR